MAITLRSVKGSALTHVEMDLNFSALTGSIEAGSGLTGGGSKSGSITLTVGQGDGIVVIADAVRVDSTVARTGSNDFLGDQVIDGNVTVTGSLLLHAGTLDVGKGESQDDGIDKLIRIGNNTFGNGRVWFAPASGSPVQTNFNEEFGFEWTSEGSGRWYVETDLIVEKDLLVEKELRVIDSLVIGSSTPSGELQEGSILFEKAINTNVDSGTRVVASVETGSYDGMVFDYIIKKATSVRVGTIHVAKVGTGTTDFTIAEHSTGEINNTNQLTFTADIDDGKIRIKAVATTDNWTVKGLVKGL